MMLFTYFTLLFPLFFFFGPHDMELYDIIVPLPILHKDRCDQDS